MSTSFEVHKYVMILFDGVTPGVNKSHVVTIYS